MPNECGKINAIVDYHIVPLAKSNRRAREIAETIHGKAGRFLEIRDEES